MEGTRTGRPAAAYSAMAGIVKMTMVQVIAILLAVLLWQLPTAPAEGAAVGRSIESGGLQRTFVLHAPSSLRADGPTALVIVLHGGGGTGWGIERSTGFSQMADRYGFVVVYPDAVERNWNDGRGDLQIRSQREGIDDVGFISAVITQVSREYSIDPRRVFATGISNGGFMSQMLAARLADRIVAIAPVAAGMGPAVAASLQPSAPVSVLVMNGTADPLVPYTGGLVVRTRGETISTDEIIRKWVTANHCAGVPVVSQLPDTDPSDGTRVTKTAYLECAQRSVVILYRIEGGGHTWPGGRQYLPRAIVGRVSRDIDASGVIWAFFASHPRP